MGNRKIGNDTAKVFIYNQSCEVITQQIITSSSLSTKELEKNITRLYPNPYWRKIIYWLFIVWYGKWSQIQIFDLMGKELQNYTVIKNQNELNLAWLAKGVYN